MMSLVQTVTVGSGGASDITFSAIPQDATDLYVLYSVRDSAAATQLQLNNSNSTIFWQLFQGPATQTSTVIYPYGTPNTFTANTFGVGQIYIPNYTSSNAKNVSIEAISENNSAGDYYFAIYGARFGSSAVTSIKIIATGTGFLQNSVASLYKITKA